MNKSEFEKDLEIDIENLDVEVCLQPELYFKYASLAKEAREDFDLAKMKLGVIEAELAQKVRLKPADFGVVKVTDASVREAIAVNPQHRVVYKAMIQARYKADLVNEAQNSMEQRKRMLEMLVQLFGREYFAGPSMPHTPAEFYRQIKKKKGEETDEAMISRARKRKRVNSG